MGDSETAKPAVKCPNCGQTVKSYQQWWEEDCPKQPPMQSDYSGHQITWAERDTLPFEKEMQ